jgi:hypothetical protein
MKEAAQQVHIKYVFVTETLKKNMSLSPSGPQSIRYARHTVTIYKFLEARMAKPSYS